MPVPGLTTLALTASRLALKLAEKRRWLPGSAWHRRSLDSLKAGNLDEAARMNRLALERNPKHDKAQVVSDLIAMRRDTATAGLQNQIDEERLQVEALEAERQDCRRDLLRSQRAGRQRRLLAWLLVPLSSAGALATGWVVIHPEFPLWSRFAAGLLGVGLVALLVLLRFTDDSSSTEGEVQDQERRAALVTLNREIEVRQRRTAELERRLQDTRHHPVGIKR